MGNNEDKTTPKGRSRSTSISEHKMMIIGTGQSGKSTLFKQIKLLTHEKINKIEDSEHTFKLICGTLVENLLGIGDYFEEENIEFDKDSTKMDFEKIKKFIEMNNLIIKLDGKRVYEKFPNELLNFWKDRAVIKYYDVAAFELLRKYFNTTFNSFVHRINPLKLKDFKITDEDILKLQIKTTGFAIYEHSTILQKNRYKLTFIDCGGQRNERVKWQKYIKSVDTIIYVASLSEFDQLCYEDDMTNRMEESLEEFEKRINSKDMENKHVILILNKFDIYKISRKRE
eukprot:gene3709-6598_t